MKVSSEAHLQRLRRQYGVELLGDRRFRWGPEDTACVKRVLADGHTIRFTAEVVRCSERTVQDVKKGLYDED